ncbi:MAG: molybdopterin molybdotransferase MoeA, partial [Ignavibacteriae bacterium]|nr:molybdopterin molybdotransferase MoeA [Ignavibacteriota bacterium]
PEALKIVLDAVRPLGTITIFLQHALGLVLVEEIISTESIPPFDNAAMDGYAVRIEDIQKIPAILTVVEEIAAGTAPNSALQAGQAMSIMTGAKIPAGCNAVVQQEWTEKIGNEQVKILRIVPDGHNIRRAGADIQKASLVFSKGQRLRPQEIGILASLGTRFVEVYRRASVSILTTGNEVVEIHQSLPEGKIRNSNAYTLGALVQELGCEAKNIGIAQDDRNDLRNKINEGLKYDMLITSGGVSVGKYDLVLDVLKELGVEIKFWKVNIKPGMPLLFGMYHEKPVFGLPGNPVSTMVTFLQFVKPALLKMMGHRAVETGLRIHARLDEDIRKTDGKRHFVRGILESRNGSLIVRTTGLQVSNLFTSLSKANCLIILPEEAEHIRAGEEIEVELL